MAKWLYKKSSPEKLRPHVRVVRWAPSGRRAVIIIMIMIPIIVLMLVEIIIMIIVVVMIFMIIINTITINHKT